MTDFPHADALLSLVHPGDDAYLALFTAWVEQTPVPIVAQLGGLPQPYLSTVYVTSFLRVTESGGYTLELEPTGIFQPLPEKED